MKYENITFEIEDGIAVLTLNRPEVLNALNINILDDILDALDKVKENTEIRALIVTAAGRGFCSGADLAPPAKPRSPGEAPQDTMKTHFNPMMSKLYNLPIPIVSAVNGVAAGAGVGVALIGDIVLAARSATFIQVFAPRIALLPDCGCTWHVPRLVGRARALGLAMLGDRLPADQAEEWGLIWKCVDDDVLMDEARAMAQRLAKNPNKAMIAVRHALDAGMENNFDDQLEYERVVQAQLGGSPDNIEGVTAFLNKREPVFKSR